jgi:hypothetical protein
MEPVAKKRLPVAAAAGNDAPEAATDMPFFIFIAGADAGAHERYLHM